MKGSMKIFAVAIAVAVLCVPGSAYATYSTSEYNPTGYFVESLEWFDSIMNAEYTSAGAAITWEKIFLGYIADYTRLTEHTVNQTYVLVSNINQMVISIHNDIDAIKTSNNAIHYQLNTVDGSYQIATFREVVNGIADGVDSQVSTLSDISTSLSNIYAEASGINTHVTAISTYAQTISSNVATLVTSIGTINTNMVDVKDNVGIIASRMTTNNNKLDTLSTKLTTINGNVTDIESILNSGVRVTNPTDLTAVNNSLDDIEDVLNQILVKPEITFPSQIAISNWPETFVDMSATNTLLTNIYNKLNSIDSRLASIIGTYTNDNNVTLSFLRTFKPSETYGLLTNLTTMNQRVKAIADQMTNGFDVNVSNWPEEFVDLSSTVSLLTDIKTLLTQINTKLGSVIGSYDLNGTSVSFVRQYQNANVYAAILNLTTMNQRVKAIADQMASGFSVNVENWPDSFVDLGSLETLLTDIKTLLNNINVKLGSVIGSYEIDGINVGFVRQYQNANVYAAIQNLTTMNQRIKSMNENLASVIGTYTNDNGYVLSFLRTFKPSESFTLLNNLTTMNQKLASLLDEVEGGLTVDTWTSSNVIVSLLTDIRGLLSVSVATDLVGSFDWTAFQGEAEELDLENTAPFGILNMFSALLAVIAVVPVADPSLTVPFNFAGTSESVVISIGWLDDLRNMIGFVCMLLWLMLLAKITHDYMQGEVTNG